MDQQYYRDDRRKDAFKYREAKKRVEAKKEFYQHITVFVVMSVFFFTLNIITAPYALWFYWPIIGWGIGVLFHYFEVFGFPAIPQMSQEWEDEQIREEMMRLEERNPPRRNRQDDDDYEQLELKQLKKEKSRQKPKWRDEDLV